MYLIYSFRFQAQKNLAYAVLFSSISRRNFSCGVGQLTGELGL